MVKITDCDLFNSGADVVCVQTNCKGSMEYGIGKQVKERFPAVFETYKDVCDKAKNNASDLLGNICETKAANGDYKFVVCCLFAHDSFKSGFCFTDYGALKECLEKIKSKYGKKKIALPYRMGCSVSGGDWRTVEELILDVMGSDCDITICRYKAND